MNLPFGANERATPFEARPIVAVRKQDRTAWWFAGAALVAAALLFSALEARRQGTEQGAARSSASTSFAAPEAIPELVVPELPTGTALPEAYPGNWARPEDRQSPSVPTFGVQSQMPINQPSAPPQPYPTSVYSTTVPQPSLMVSGQDDAPGQMPLVSEGAAPNSAGGQALSYGRVSAKRLENPATTVIQGTLINAVLETALDSTQPGQSRALVTRDVFGFDGTRLLIPRGTRLYGIYEANVAQGQNRAQIRWARLLRPDGVSIALDSPAADPLGRAGVQGKVNNHFFQRFGNALLGTTMNIGSALATRNVSTPVIVAVPGATQSASQIMAPNSAPIAPTLTVRQGTRITVFVQHDLDFSSVDEGS
jgi:type IV secretion system protein VirB10